MILMGFINTRLRFFQQLALLFDFLHFVATERKASVQVAPLRI